jgi:leucyl aminopeptidase
MISVVYVLIVLYSTKMSVCQSFKLRSLGGYLRNRTIRMNIMDSIWNRFSSSKPTSSENDKTPSNSINYAKESTRFLSNIISQEEAMKRNISSDTLFLVPMTAFDGWKANLSSRAVELYESINEPMKKYPGTKIIVMPDEINGKVISKSYLFYDEKKLTYKTFESIWSAIVSKNRTYHIAYYDRPDELEVGLATTLLTSWAIASYRYNFYRSVGIKKVDCKLIWPKNCQIDQVTAIASAYTMMRDLAETPALNLGPAELRQAAVEILSSYGVQNITTIVGVDDLKDNNYSQIAAVGMASSPGREPCLVDARWTLPSEPGSTNAYPEVVIIGKGVVFDTGGLNIKSTGGMRNMKKDMSGAAQVGS